MSDPTTTLSEESRLFHMTYHSSQGAQGAVREFRHVGRLEEKWNQGVPLRISHYV